MARTGPVDFDGSLLNLGDESAGTNPTEKRDLSALIRSIAADHAHFVHT